VIREEAQRSNAPMAALETIPLRLTEDLLVLPDSELLGMIPGFGLLSKVSPMRRARVKKRKPSPTPEQAPCG